MGTPRTRSREFTLHTPGQYQTGYYPGGNWTPLGGPTGGSSLPNIWEYCSDTIEPPPFTEPHSLLIEKKKVTPLQFWGEARLSSFNYRRHSGWNPANYTGHLYVSSPGPTDWNYWKAKAMAAINPFNPQVDIPLFLFELREFPRMLRGLGNVLSGRARPKDVPGGYLAYNFGWAPLVSDLASLVNFGELMAKQRRYLTDAANGNRVRRQLGTREISGSVGDYAYPLGIAGTWLLGQTRSTKIRAWCTARIHLNEPLPSSAQELDWLALRTALGLHLNPSTLWDAIPWTWLIDYFVNIGDLVEARNGFLRWRFSDLFVMVTTSHEVKITHEKNKIGSMSFSGGRKSYIRKERSYVGANPNLGLGLNPILSGYQMSILGALLTAGALKRL